MSQQQSPWLETAYGWAYGENGWNSGMDSNLLKFSVMFDRNVDSIVESLPPAVNGQVHYNTTDNRLYFAVNTTYFSTPVPKWFEFKERSTGLTYQFNGTSPVQIDSPGQLDTRLDAVEFTVNSLGTAAFEDIGVFASQADLDIVEADSQNYTDALRLDLADPTELVKGSGMVGNNSLLTYPVNTVGRAINNIALGITEIIAPATSAEIQAVIDAKVGGVIRFKGIFTITSPVTLRNGIIYEGLGVDIYGGGGTRINYTGTEDAFLIQNPINGSTSANIEIRGIWFYSDTLTVDNALLFDTASSVVVIRRCRFNSPGCGITLDQSELWDIELCSFNATAAGAASIWIVNGDDKNPTADAFFTNRIGVRSCEFNGADGSVSIYDDGGTAHTFENNNYNAAGSHIIATSVNGLKIDGGEFEISSAPSIILGLTTRKLGMGAKSPIVSIARTFYYNNIDQPAVAAVIGAVGQLELIANFLNTTGSAYTGLSASCDRIVARSNAQLGAGPGGAAINNEIDLLLAPTSWNATTVAPAIGNGTLSSTYSRRGKLVDWRLKLLFGSTTTAGTGEWYFSLPFAADTADMSAIGAAVILIPGVSYYTAAVKVETDGINARVYITAGAGTVGSAVPVAWVDGSLLEFQVSYTAASPI